MTEAKMVKLKRAPHAGVFFIQPEGHEHAFGIQRDHIYELPEKYASDTRFVVVDDAPKEPASIQPVHIDAIAPETESMVDETPPVEEPKVEEASSANNTSQSFTDTVTEIPVETKTEESSETASTKDPFDI